MGEKALTSRLSAERHRGKYSWRTQAGLLPPLPPPSPNAELDDVSTAPLWFFVSMLNQVAGCTIILEDIA